MTRWRTRLDCRHATLLPSPSPRPSRPSVRLGPDDGRAADRLDLYRTHAPLVGWHRRTVRDPRPRSRTCVSSGVVAISTIADLIHGGVCDLLEVVEFVKPIDFRWHVVVWTCRSRPDQPRFVSAWLLTAPRCVSFPLLPIVWITPSGDALAFCASGVCAR